MANEEWEIGDECVIRSDDEYRRAKVVRLTSTRVMVEMTAASGHKFEEAFHKVSCERVGRYGWGAQPKIERPSTNSATFFARRAMRGTAEELRDLANGAIAKVDLVGVESIRAVLNDAIAKIAAIKGQ